MALLTRNRKPAGNKSKAVKKPSALGQYGILLQDIKTRIRAAQVRASMSANREMILLYWSIGHLVTQRQAQEGWGAAVIPRLARDLQKEFPDLKGFSERNIGRMIHFAREYGVPPILPQPAAKLNEGEFGPQAVAQLPGGTFLPQLAAKFKKPEILPQRLAKIAKSDPLTIVQQLAAQFGPQDAARSRNTKKLPQPAAKLANPDTIQQLALNVPWFHHIILMERVKDLSARLWYVEKTIENGWSRNVLALMIESRAHARHGKAVNNFARTLPPPQSDLACQTLKDPYIFDFLTLDKPFHERELETGLLRHLQDFLVELGAGFAYVGRQVRLDVDGEDYYLDLLFYQLRLRCYVVIELKAGPFLPEYAGKMNFYLNAVDDLMRHPDDRPSIGLILCQDKKRIVAEYALRGMTKAIGVSQYQLTRALPKQLRSALPSIEQIEAELTGKHMSKGKKPPQ